MKEYESLKPISMFALSKTVTCGTEMRKFTLMFIPKYEWKEEVPLSEIVKHFPHQPQWAPKFISHGFIREVEPEVFYGTGDKFKNNYSGQKYILAMVGDEKVNLICLKDGYRWSGAVFIKNPEKITENEFKLLIGGGDFTKID